VNNVRLSVLLAVAGAILAACVQMPTEKQQSVDLRPQLSFAVSLGGPAADNLEVYVDGLPMGRVSNFLVGQQALRVLPGTHVVRIMSGQSVIKEERIYVGDAMTKVITVN
jgi:hypothetical protein